MPNLTDIHTELMAVIEDIDTKLDSLVDSDTAGKRKVGNDLVTEAESLSAPVIDQLVPQIQEMDERTKAGVYLGLVRALRGTFDEEVSKYIAAIAETMPKPEPLVTEEEAKVLAKTRSELYQKVKNVVDLNAQFGEAELKMPKMRRGSRGKRGPRALTFYTWAINGEEVSEDDDNVKGVSALLGFEKAAEFTKALREGRENEQDKIDTTNPPEKFEWKHPDGRVVSATRIEDDDTPAEDEAQDLTEPSTTE